MIISIRNKDETNGHTVSKTNQDSSSHTAISLEDSETDESLSSSQKNALPLHFSRRNLKPEISERLLRNSNHSTERCSLSLNKLQYDQVGFFGRETETATLRDCLNRLVSDEDGRKKELVLIKGYSGTGKSRLASTLRDSDIFESKKGLLVEGKADFHNNAPCSSIAAAFGEICRSIQQNPLGSDIEEAIMSELGAETNLLAKLIPELTDLIPTGTQADIQESDSGDFAASQEKWKYSFRLLTKVLNKHIPIMILVLDDLQWADAASLEVIDYLISDTQNRNRLMIIGCFRSNEVDDAHKLSNKLYDLEEKRARFRFNITEIELWNLGPKETNQIIMALLSIDNPLKTQQLAEICFKRTQGNPFFLIEFVTMLVDEKLIVFSLGLLKWIWDEKVIEHETMSTANVVELLQSRLKKLPLDTQLVLRDSACLGASFALPTLQMLWKKHAATSLSPESDDLLDLVRILQEENLIERCSANQDIRDYRFAHDKIKEAALSFDGSNKLAFQYEIGRCLFDSMSDEELEENLFEVVDLINKGDSTQDRDYEYAKLNLRAAKKAKSISAFQSAARYVEHGILHLSKDKWISAEREVALQLYTLGTKAEFALGREWKTEMYSNEVLSQKRYSTLEKVPLYVERAKQLIFEGKHKESLKLSLEVLEELDCSLVRNRFLLPLLALGSLRSTIKRAHRISKEKIKDQAVMTDPKQIAKMELLYRVTVPSYFAGETILFVLAATRQVQKVMEHGLVELGGVAYNSLAMVCILVFRRFDVAEGFAEKALAINDKFGGFWEASILFVAHKYVLPWTRLLLSCILPLERAYSVGMRSGNVESAPSALVASRVQIPYMMGKPLGRILSKLRAFESSDLNRSQDLAILTKLYLEAMLDLTDDSAKRTRSVMRLSVVDPGKSPSNKAILDFMEMDLLLVFGDYEAAADIALRVGDSCYNILVGDVVNMRETFVRAAALYAMALRTGKRVYKKPAKKILRTIQGWCRKGNPNVNHYVSFLRAEQAALDRRHEVAEHFYQEAIVIAARSGYLQDAALATERYSNFLGSVMQDAEEADYQLSEAIRFYLMWGAKAKVAALEGSRGTLRGVRCDFTGAIANLEITSV